MFLQKSTQFLKNYVKVRFFCNFGKFSPKFPWVLATFLATEELKKVSAIWRIILPHKWQPTELFSHNFLRDNSGFRHFQRLYFNIFSSHRFDRICRHSLESPESFSRNFLYRLSQDFGIFISNTSTYTFTLIRQNFAAIFLSHLNRFHVIFCNLSQDFGIFNSNTSTFFQINLTEFRRHSSESPESFSQFSSELRTGRRACRESRTLFWILVLIFAIAINISSKFCPLLTRAVNGSTYFLTSYEM